MSESKVAAEIFEKIIEIFPDFKTFIDEDIRDLSYVTMGYLADYIETFPDPANNPTMISRVKAFSNWSLNHSRGIDAGDDILTIFVVGFLEKLFESPKLSTLVSKILTREELEANKDYWITWVGAASYAQTLAAFAQKG